jgi:hypothetical protein
MTSTCSLCMQKCPPINNPNIYESCNKCLHLFCHTGEDRIISPVQRTIHCHYDLYLQEKRIASGLLVLNSKEFASLQLDPFDYIEDYLDRRKC